MHNGRDNGSVVGRVIAEQQQRQEAVAQAFAILDALFDGVVVVTHTTTRSSLALPPRPNDTRIAHCKANPSSLMEMSGIFARWCASVPFQQPPPEAGGDGLKLTDS